jgi:centrosomal protein CEP76
MELLKRKGVVQDILQALSSTSPTEPTILPHERKPVLLNLKDTYLSLSLLGGKAFLEHAIPATEPRVGFRIAAEHQLNFSQKQSTFQVHLQFKNQRFHSEPVAAACEPAFSDVFFLKLQVQ